MVFCGKAPRCQIYLEVSLKSFPVRLCFINPLIQGDNNFNFIADTQTHSATDVQVISQATTKDIFFTFVLTLWNT